MKEFVTTTMHPRRLMLALLLSLLAGCGGGGGSDPVIPEALTELDFAADPSLRLVAGEVGVTFLEPKDAVPATSDDTGLPGTDEFPLRIAEQTTSTYAIDSADDTIAMVKLIRLTGNEELFVINAAQPSATVTLEPGDYKLVVYSGYTVAEASGETHRAVFLHDNTSTPAQAAMNASVPRKSVLAAATSTEILFTRLRCIRCDLTRAKLYYGDLSGVNLTEANLTGAYLTSADLTRANLTDANLTRAYLTSANLTGANLTSANLTRAKLYGANLSGAKLYVANLTSANLNGANLSGAKLSGANLIGANLAGANLNGAVLNGATWTDGRICAVNSIRTCK